MWKFFERFKKQATPETPATPKVETAQSKAAAELDAYISAAPREKTYTQKELEHYMGLAYNCGVDDGMEGVPQEVYDKAYIHPTGVNTAHLEWFAQRWNTIKTEILKLDSKYF